MPGKVAEVALKPVKAAVTGRPEKKAPLGTYVYIEVGRAALGAGEGAYVTGRRAEREENGKAGGRRHREGANRRCGPEYTASVARLALSTLRSKEGFCPPSLPSHPHARQGEDDSTQIEELGLQGPSDAKDDSVQDHEL